MQPAESIPNANPPRRQRLTHLLLAAAVVLTGAAMMDMNQADPDLWGHLQYGREVLRDGTLPVTTTWTFTSPEHRWINHENLAEIVMAWTMDSFGPRGLLIGKFLLSLILLGLAYWSSLRQGASRAIAVGVCLVLALATEFHWHFRPQVFGYTLFAVLAVLLDRCLLAPEAEKSSRRLLWLLPVVVLWTNTHGSFPAGVAITLAALGLAALDRIIQLGMARSVRSVLGLCLIAVAVATATLVNPYGYELPQWLFHALSIPRPEIGDWERLPLDGSRLSICFAIMAGTTAVACSLDWRRNWKKGLLLGLLVWQAYAHVRHLPLLAIAWAMWIPQPLDELRRRLVPDLRTDSPSPLIASPQSVHTRRSWLAPMALSVWMLFIGFLAWPKLTTLEVDPHNYPVDALRFMSRQDLHGRTIVTFNWAQFALATFAHEGMQSTVAFDGRFRTAYSQPVIDRYFDFLFGPSYEGPRYRSPKSGPIDPQAALVKDSPELVLISRQQRPSVRTMEASTDRWVLLYQNPISQVWGLKAIFDDPRINRYLPACERDLNAPLTTLPVAFPAFPSAAAANSR